MNQDPVPPASAATDTSAPDAKPPPSVASPADSAVDPPVVSQRLEALRTRDKRIGLAMIAGAFVLSLLISLWAKRVSGPEPSVAPAPPTTLGIPGFPDKIDALKALPLARRLTPRPYLRGIVIEGVKHDGTVDVNSGAEVRYSFQSPAGQGPQPPRKPGVVPRKNNCGKQSVRITAGGIGAELDQPGIPCLLPVADPLPEPRCTLEKVWSAALRRGATKSGRARIEYYRAMAGPAWRIEVPGGLRLNLYGDCERELARNEAASAPH
jgi:hypothetical protein